MLFNYLQTKRSGGHENECLVRNVWHFPEELEGGGE